VLGGAVRARGGLTPGASVREDFFQVAIAGYLGALLNLNPLLERDGYHVLADLLGAPGLQRRAAQRVRGILAGRATRADSELLLWRYGVASLCWSALTVAFAIAMSLRYYHRLVSLAPRAVVWTLLGELQIQWFIDQALAVRAAHAGDPAYRRDPSRWGEWVADVDQPAAIHRGRYETRLPEAQALLAGFAVHAAPLPPPGPEAGEAAARVAQRYLGTPYDWGGSSPRTGLDCSRLLQFAFAQGTLPAHGG
jgi:hypothetical protein